MGDSKVSIVTYKHVKVSNLAGGTEVLAALTEQLETTITDVTVTVLTGRSCFSTVYIPTQIKVSPQEKSDLAGLTRLLGETFMSPTLPGGDEAVFMCNNNADPHILRDGTDDTQTIEHVLNQMGLSFNSRTGQLVKLSEDAIPLLADGLRAAERKRSCIPCAVL